MPNGWSGWWATDVVQLEPTGNTSAVFVLHVPFTHTHGGQGTTELRATSADGSGALEVGVSFTDVGYPSGHHDTVYLHATHDKTCVAGTCTDFPPRWMNTLRDDEDAGNTILEQGGYPLSPATLMGIAFDDHGSGVFRGTFVTDDNYDGASVTVRIAMIDDSESTRPGSGPYTEVLQGTQSTGSLSAGDSWDVEVPLNIIGETFRFPYKAGQNLHLYFHTSATPPLLPTGNPNALGLQLQAGASATLPLLDWSDDVEQVVRGSSESSTIRLHVETPHRFVNPGAAAVFNVTATSQGAKDVTLDLIGHNADWATVGDATRTLPTGASTIPIAITVPEDATAGARADVYLRVTDDAGAVSIARVIAEVVTDETTVDESELAKQVAAAEDKKSPGPAALLPILATLWLRRSKAASMVLK